MKRNNFTLEEIDFCREFGILYFDDEDDENHISIETKHNFMCDICHHYIDQEEGFLVIPLSRLKHLMEKCRVGKVNNNEM